MLAYLQKARLILQLVAQITSDDPIESIADLRERILAIVKLAEALGVDPELLAKIAPWIGNDAILSVLLPIVKKLYAKQAGVTTEAIDFQPLIQFLIQLLLAWAQGK